ncbi:uncharacterized protein LOC112449861 isoform X1 [Kryptolebias marmoratus]|uniref:uncharacterized protein LOC112449861 isoform X1 n=2 Tax=Kryptolebias marmoratus TaxID=37003 RepID=UPI000D5308F6|nr:uncharacterized protein LOC112449861 isoform X1 [Kryptolebias marmoratus]
MMLCVVKVVGCLCLTLLAHTHTCGGVCHVGGRPVERQGQDQKKEGLCSVMLRGEKAVRMMENPSLVNNSLSGANSDTFRSCLIITPSTYIYTAHIVIKVLFFFPLFIFILYYGLQKWRKNRSNSSASALNHSDCFTYHLVLIELVGVFGCFITFGGIYKIDLKIIQVGKTLYSFSWYGQGLFHILTCVEHYLAVVHPITYLTLREKRKLIIRNIIIGCVWLLSLVGMALSIEEHYVIMDSCFIILTITITPFCSLSVLCFLSRSGPGESNAWNERGDQSKQRAFYTIVSIQLVLLLRLAWTVVFVFYTVKKTNNCVVKTCESLFNLPSSLVLPLLFLQRAGKLMCSENIS